MSRTPRHKVRYAIALSAALAVAGVVAWSLWWHGSRPMSDALDYDRLVNLDAEELAEGGIGKAYEALRSELRKHIAEPATVAESTDDNAPRYSVRCGAKEFVIYAPGDEDESWGRATFAFFAIVNDQLADSEYRFYAINSGNDLGGMFLTPAQAQAARGTLPHKRYWPYLPNNQPPWYGQPH